MSSLRVDDEDREDHDEDDDDRPSRRLSIVTNDDHDEEGNNDKGEATSRGLTLSTTPRSPTAPGSTRSSGLAISATPRSPGPASSLSRLALSTTPRSPMSTTTTAQNSPRSPSSSSSLALSLGDDADAVEYMTTPSPSYPSSPADSQPFLLPTLELTEKERRQFMDYNRYFKSPVAEETKQYADFRDEMNRMIRKQSAIASGRSYASPDDESKWVPLYAKMISFSQDMKGNRVSCERTEESDLQCSTKGTNAKGQQGKVVIGCPSEKQVYKKINMADVMKFHSSKLDSWDYKLFVSICRVATELYMRLYYSASSDGASDDNSFPVLSRYRPDLTKAQLLSIRQNWSKPVESPKDCWYCKDNTIDGPSIGMIMPKLNGVLLGKWLESLRSHVPDENGKEDDDMRLIQYTDDLPNSIALVQIAFQGITGIMGLYECRAKTSSAAETKTNKEDDNDPMSIKITDALYINDCHPDNIMIQMTVYNEKLQAAPAPLWLNPKENPVRPAVWFGFKNEHEGYFRFDMDKLTHVMTFFDYGFMTAGVPLDGSYRPMSSATHYNAVPDMDLMYFMGTMCKRCPLFNSLMKDALKMDHLFRPVAAREEILMRRDALPVFAIVQRLIEVHSELHTALSLLTSLDSV